MQGHPQNDEMATQSMVCSSRQPVCTPYPTQPLNLQVRICHLRSRALPMAHKKVEAALGAHRRDLLPVSQNGPPEEEKSHVQVKFPQGLIPQSLSHPLGHASLKSLASQCYKVAPSVVWHKKHRILTPRPCHDSGTRESLLTPLDPRQTPGIPEAMSNPLRR